MVISALGVGGGVAAAGWQQNSATVAEPMPAATATQVPGLTQRGDGTSRDQSRPDLDALRPSTDPSGSSSASAKPEKKDGKSDEKDKSDKKDKSDEKGKSDEAEKSDGKGDNKDGKDGKSAKDEKPEPKPTPEKVEDADDVDITGSRWTTVDLNVRTGPDASSNVVTVLDTGTKVKVTSDVDDGFRKIVYRDEVRWVSTEYLSKSKPKPEDDGDSDGGSGGGISGAPCPSGSSVEQGLTQDAIAVHRAICHRWPQVDSFGGTRASSDYHGTGQAIDAMISDPQVGREIANWVRAHASELGVSEVIHAQRIWTVQRSGEGWRPMEDRGSATANHYDHVHVSVYGNAGNG